MSGVGAFVFCPKVRYFGCGGSLGDGCGGGLGGGDVPGAVAGGHQEGHCDNGKKGVRLCVFHGSTRRIKGVALCFSVIIPQI